MVDLLTETTELSRDFVADVFDKSQALGKMDMCSQLAVSRPKSLLIRPLHLFYRATTVNGFSDVATIEG